jgi:hypothetical protein
MYLTIMFQSFTYVFSVMPAGGFYLSQNVAQAQVTIQYCQSYC